MTYVNLFLASSLEDLSADREALGNYIRTLNDIYLERGVYFRLFQCEQDSLSISRKSRKQEEYNDRIRDSQLFFILFFNKAGQYTLEEFQVAYDHFKAAGAPSIVTCFRQGAGYAPNQSVLDFMEKLDKELGHYFKVYTHIDSLKLSLLMQLKLMELDVPVEVLDSKVTLDGQTVLTLENIPMFANNTDFRQLKAHYEQAHRAYLDAFHSGDPESPEFLRAATVWGEAKKALRSLEKDLMSIALAAEREGVRGRLTPRQRKAYALLEQGDARGADRVLDLHEILEETRHNQSLADMALERLSQNVQELLLKVDALTVLTSDPDRFRKIRAVYDEAVALEERYNLPKTAMERYIRFLHEQNDFSAALPLAQRFAEKYMKWEGSAEDRIVSLNQLGLLWQDTHQYARAEETFLQAKALCEEQAKADPKAALMSLSSVCNNLGSLYNRMHRYPEALSAYLQARELRQKLYDASPDLFRWDLAVVCNNLGTLYCNMYRYPEAEGEYLLAKDLRQQLAREDPGRYLSALAVIYGNLGNLYHRMQHYPEAVETYKEAKTIWEKLAAENPEANLPDLANICNSLGIVYHEMGANVQAEQELKQAKDICERLAQEKPQAFLPDLANICNSLGQFYVQLQRHSAAEEAFLRARTIWETLAGTTPEVFLPDLAIVCNNLGALYDRMKRYDQAETAYLRAQEIRLKQAQQDPGNFLPSLATVCSNLGSMYRCAGRYEDAEAQMRQAKILWEPLAEANPEAFLVDLADIYCHLALLYRDTRRVQAAIGEFLLAMKVKERLAKANPDVYLPELADLYCLLGALYCDEMRYRKSEEFLTRAKGIFEKLALSSPERYLPELALCCSSLGSAYSFQDRRKPARAAFLAAKQHYTAAAAYDPAYLREIPQLDAFLAGLK